MCKMVQSVRGDDFFYDIFVTGGVLKGHPITVKREYVHAE